MVLNDITKDYEKFVSILDKYSEEDSYIKSALSIIDQYQKKIYVLADTFLKSAKREGEKNNLINGLNGLENAFKIQIANMNTSIRDTIRLITEIEHIEFISSSVEAEAHTLCGNLNDLMDITEEYAANRIKGQPNTVTFFELISKLDDFKKEYSKIISNRVMLVNVETELLEKLPFATDEEITYYSLDIRSSKPELDIASFTEDLSLLTSCLQQLERLVAPGFNHSIYMRKIESGSLKALFGSDKVDLSIFPDLITSISNAIKSWRMTPVEKARVEAETDKIRAETALIQAQTQAQYIQNEGSKLAIANSQINFICEKLQLDANNPEHVEQIQKFCLPLINYLEHNPIGKVNEIPYDISKEIYLLENSEK